jgi:hypothetical protein
MSALDCVIVSFIYILKTFGNEWWLTFGAVHSVLVVHGDITGVNPELQRHS